MPPYSQNIPLSCRLNNYSISLFLLYHSPHASIPPSTGSKMVASPPGCNYCLVPVFKVSNFPHRIRPLLSAMSNQHQHTYAQRRILSHLHGERDRAGALLWKRGSDELLMISDHPDIALCVRCCCICIFAAVLSPSCLFTIA